MRKFPTNDIEFNEAIAQINKRHRRISARIRAQLRRIVKIQNQNDVSKVEKLTDDLFNLRANTRKDKLTFKFMYEGMIKA